MDRLHRCLLFPILVLLLATGGCSGSRPERIPSECLRASECEAGEQCRSGSCVVTEVASVRAVGTVAGAPEGTLVSARVRDAEPCVARDEAEVVCTVAAGEQVLLEAPEIEGHRFAGWSGAQAACQSAAPTLELALSEDTRCIARYVRRLRVSGAVAGDDPALAVSASATAPFAACSGSSCVVDQGDSVTLTAPERDGYRLVSFTGEGCGELRGYRVVVTPRDADVSCLATYRESLTVRARAEGLADGVEAPLSLRAEGSGSSCEGTLCAVDPGASVTLIAGELAGYRFHGWSGDPACGSGQPSTTLVGLANNLVCVANYVRRFSVQGRSQGVAAPISASSPSLFARCEGARCELDRGEGASVVAGTVAGYRLKSWSGEGCVDDGGDTASVAEVAADLTCTAHYVQGVAVSGSLVNAPGNVVASSSSPGAECVRGRCAVDLGGTVTLTAPQLEGRTFLGWSGDPACRGSTRSVTLSDVRTSKACRATFAPRFRVSGRALPESSGAVAASAAGPTSRCQAASCEVDQGASVVLTASAAERRRFAGWSGGGPCSGSAARLELSDVRADVTCSAGFVDRVRVAAAVSPPGAGSVVASSMSTAARCVEAGCTVDVGAAVMLRALPGPNHRFLRWSGCQAATTPTLTLSAASEQLCTAEFELVTRTVSALAESGGSVSASAAATVCPSAVCTVPHGGAVTLTATPSSGYVFDSWSGCSNSPNAILTLSSVVADQICTARFHPPVVVSAVASPSASGSVQVSAPTGSCSEARCTLPYGGRAILTATAARGYRFDHWSGEGCTLYAPSYDMQFVDRDHACTANFVPLPRASVRADFTPSGLDAAIEVSSSDPSAVCSGASCTVDSGGSVLLRVSRVPLGFRFAGWASCGGASASASQITVVATQVETVCSARFERDTRTITVGTTGGVGATLRATTAAGNVCYQGPGGTCVVPYGETVTVEVPPDGLTGVMRWIGCGAHDGSSATRVTVQATENLTCLVELFALVI